MPKFSGSVALPGFTVPAGETWDFDPNVSTTVTVTANVVVEGTLQMRPAPGVVHKLVFSGVSEAGFVGGGHNPLASDPGLWVVGSGRLDAVGAAKVEWGRAKASVPVGATSLTLDRTPTGWQVGDEIAIVPTERPTVTGHYTRFEVRTITAVSGDTVSWAGGLAYPHPAVTLKPGLTLGAEVLNLTRNVRIEGMPGGRTHVFVGSDQPQTVSHVAIRHVGPQRDGDSILGRYGLHLHHAEGEGSSFTGLVVRDAGAHAYAPHHVHGATFRRCIAYDCFDEPFWWDPPATQDDRSNDSHDVVYDGCVAAKFYLPPNNPGFHTLAGFALMAGTGNRAVGCVAVGCNGGKTSSGFIWGSKSNESPGAWVTSDLVSHNHRAQGFYVWQNAVAPDFTDDRALIYHCTDVGIDWGAYANGSQFRDTTIVGCLAGGVRLHAQSAAAPRQLRLTRPHIDCADMSPHAVTVFKHYADPPNFVLLDGGTYKGFTKSAVGSTFPGNPHADRVEMRGLVCEGNALWLEPAIHPGSEYRVDGLIARRYDQPGTLRPEWNARVT